MRGFGTRFVAMGIAGLYYVSLVAILLILTLLLAPQIVPESLPYLEAFAAFWQEIAKIVALFIPAGIVLKLIGIYILREPQYMDQPRIGRQYIGLPALLRNIIDRFGAI